MEAHVGRRAKPEVAPKAFFVWVLVCAFAICCDSVDLVAPVRVCKNMYNLRAAVHWKVRICTTTHCWALFVLPAGRTGVKYNKMEDASAYFGPGGGSQFEGLFLPNPRRV